MRTFLLFYIAEDGALCTQTYESFEVAFNILSRDMNDGEQQQLYEFMTRGLSLNTMVMGRMSKTSILVIT